MPTPYTFPWDETDPPGSTAANQIDDKMRAHVINIRERFVDILGVTFPGDTITEVTASKLVLKGAVSPKIIPGATSLLFRNNADSQDNLVISNSGVVTVPSGDFNVGGNIAGARYAYVSTNSGFERGFVFRTQALNRWKLAVNNTAEAGANAGSDFQIIRHDDAGVLIDVPFSINRSTGISTFLKNVIISTGGLTVSANGILVTGDSTLTGDLTLTNAASARNLIISAPAGSLKQIVLRSGGSNRWLVNSNNTAESGGSAGSDFQIQRVADDGATINTALTVVRSSGLITISSGLQINTVGLTIVAGGANITGAVSVVNNLTLTTSAVDRILAIASSAGFNRQINFNTGALLRWQINANNLAEGGANAGTNFEINRYNDAGVVIDTPFSIVRNSGRITIADGLTIFSNGVTVISGTSTFNDDLIRFETASPSSVFIQADAGQNRKLFFDSGIVRRFALGASNSAEGGGNSGSDFVIERYNDAGILIDTPLKIFTTSGTITVTTIAATGSVQATFFDTSGNGYRYGGIAINGHFLRGNGTDFVDGAIQSTDLPVLEGVSVYTSVLIDIAAATLTALNFDSETEDSTGTMHTGGNPSRLIAPTAGRYNVTAHITLIGIAGNAFIVLRKNGVATNLKKTSLNIVGSSAGTLEINTSIVLAASDYIEVYVQSDNAANDVIQGQENSYFQMYKVSN